MSNLHLLFYASSGCEYSNLFIKKIKEEDMLNLFKLIDVLELHRKGQKIPPEITNTPTIIIQNTITPLTGADAFAWVENSKYFYQKTNNIHHAAKAVTYVPKNTDESTEGADLKKNEEFANIKDADDEEITKKKYNGATQNVSITNSASHQSVTDQKMTQDVQNKRLQELLNLRNMQLAKYRMK
jgi:hypothetical protein